MQKKWQIILSGIVLCLLIGVAWGFYLYTKPHANAGGKATDVTLSADSLYGAYKKDEPNADKSFLNKIVEVKGVVQSIEMSNGRPVVILSTGDDGNINCQMALDSTAVFATLHKASTVTIKGKCSGYLMDVNLVDCVIK